MSELLELEPVTFYPPPIRSSTKSSDQPPATVYPGPPPIKQTKLPGGGVTLEEFQQMAHVAQMNGVSTMMIRVCDAPDCKERINPKANGYKCVFCPEEFDLCDTCENKGVEKLQCPKNYGCRKN